MKFTKNQALDIFSFFSIGTFLGCISFGFISDIFPMRSPVMLTGLALSTLLMFVLGFDSYEHTNPPSEFVYGLITFLVGACMYGP